MCISTRVIGISITSITRILGLHRCNIVAIVGKWVLINTFINPEWATKTKAQLSDVLSSTTKKHY
jgi:hypothetical protein